MTSLNVAGVEFQSLIDANEIVFVDFWADWCAPCKQFSQVYEQVVAQFPNIKFAKVNIETEQWLVDSFKIRSIPYLMVFKKGIVVYANAGSMPASTLMELIDHALVVDVSAIEEELQKQDNH